MIFRKERGFILSFKKFSRTNGMNFFLKYRGSFGWDRIVFRARVVQRQDKLEADVLSLQCVQFSFSFPSSFRLFATNARTSVHLNIRNTCYGTAYSSSWYRAHTPVFDDHPRKALVLENTRRKVFQKK